jgi:uncharacterized protein YbaR (Trm112 family)
MFAVACGRASTPSRRAAVALRYVRSMRFGRRGDRQDSPKSGLSGMSVATATERQGRVLDLLVCPRCRRDLVRRRVHEARGFVFDADLECDSCGVVAVVRDGVPDFLMLVDDWTGVPRGLATVPLPVELASLDRRGAWQPIEPGLHGLAHGAKLRGRLDARGIWVELQGHPWSSGAIVSFGRQQVELDLYRPEPERQIVHIVDDKAGHHPWSIEVRPRTHPDSLGDQVIVRDIRALVVTDAAEPPGVAAVNRGNPYPPMFEQILAETQDDAVVLDLGGGDRRHPDPRVLNMEYLPYRAVDFRGDGLQLPLRDASVDLILSQAVLEHVPEPQRAVDEFRRVLRPGGRIYAEFAFMQPLHAVPFHFFNITPHGAALLFDDFDVTATGVFGGLADTMGWFFRILDASRLIGEDRSNEVIASLRDLDDVMTPEQLGYMASAVYVDAIRPVGPSADAGT